MSDKDRITVEGEPPAKPFRVLRIGINNEPIYPHEAEYGTIDEVNAHRWVLGHRYKIEVRKKLMTVSEFREWAKKQK
jgi:hypothetical protein